MFLIYKKPLLLENNKKYYFFRESIIPVKENKDNINGSIFFFFKPKED